MGVLQQVTVPLPPLVIITSAPHLEQMYLFPTLFAILYASLQFDLFEVWIDDQFRFCHRLYIVGAQPRIDLF